MMGIFRDSARLAWCMLLVVAAVAAGSALLAVDTLNVRFERDIARIGFNQNWELLDDVTRQAGLVSDSLASMLAENTSPMTGAPYLVVSIADRRLWYKQGAQTLFTTQVAVGSGRTLVQRGGHDEWKFDTPRGRLVVQSKEVDPVWIPPDWHYVEVAHRRGLGVIHLERGQSLAAPDGSTIRVAGSDVVRRYPDGRVVPFASGEGKEIVVGGNVVVPPYGTNQRKFRGVVGTHRLNLGDGYAVHGTDQPSSIGRAVSHGCIRVRNEDIAHLYQMVAVGTPVYVY